MHQLATAAPPRGCWERVTQLTARSEHGTLGYQREIGEFLATIEVDYYAQLNTTIGYGYRWRVYVNGKQINGGVGPLGHCVEKADEFIADWPRYTPEAQAALLADPF